MLSLSEEKITIFDMDQRRSQVKPTTQCQALDQQRLGWQECDGGLKTSKPSTLSLSHFKLEIPSHQDMFAQLEIDTRAVPTERGLYYCTHKRDLKADVILFNRALHTNTT